MEYNDETGNIKLSEEEFNKLDKMINGISWKYNGWSGLEQEDIAMELWIKTCEVIKYTGNINYNLIARCCYNKAIDMCRSARKTVTNSFSASEFLESCFNSDKDFAKDSDNGSINISRNSDFYSKTDIEDMIKLFDPDTKERKYIILMILYLGLDEEIFNNPGSCYDKLFGNERMDYEIAKKLNYANDTSQGYRQLRERVRNKLRENGFTKI
jgi:hypothetical protein